MKNEKNENENGCLKMKKISLALENFFDFSSFFLKIFFFFRASFSSQFGGGEKRSRIFGRRFFGRLVQVKKFLKVKIFSF